MDNENSNSRIIEGSAGKKPERKRVVWFVISGVLVLAIGVLFVTKISVPFAMLSNGSLLFICLTLLGFTLGMGFKRAWLKVIAFCLVAVFAAFAVVEVYLAARERSAQAAQAGTGDTASYTTEEGIVIEPSDARRIFEEHGIETSPNATTEPHMNTYDDLLGYRIMRDTDEVLGIKLDGVEHGDDIIYMAAYHLNADGWRVTPQYPEAREAVILLGDSFTFSQGLNDEDSFPYQVGQALGSNYQTFCFGVPGWGTHQLMAMVENGWFDTIYQTYDKVHFFYMPIEHHKERIFGEVSWDPDGPCYELLPDGTVQYLGPFSSAKNEQENSSKLFGKLSEDQYKEDLMRAMIRQMNQIMQEKYDSELVLLRVLYSCEFLNVLADEGITILHEDISPVEDYLIPGDGHPNAKGAEVFATQVVTFLQAG